MSDLISQYQNFDVDEANDRTAGVALQASTSKGIIAGIATLGVVGAGVNYFMSPIGDDMTPAPTVSPLGALAAGVVTGIIAAAVVDSLSDDD